MSLGWNEVIVGLLFSLNVAFVVWIRVTLSLLEDRVSYIKRSIEMMNNVLTKGDANDFGYATVRDRMDDIGETLREVLVQSRQTSEKTIEALNNLTIAIKELQATLRRNGR